MSRYEKRQKLKKQMQEKIKEQGADAVYGTTKRVQSQKQIFRHGVRDYSDGKSIATKVDSNLTNATIDKNQVIPNGVTVNQADVENGLELVVPVGDLVAKKKNKTVKRIQNPLHKFNTNNAIFTLAALTLDEVNFPDETLMKGYAPKYIVAKSAGGSARESNLAKEPLALEFYIDNVQIEAIIHSNTKTGHTQGTTITFTVQEPFSLGLFLQNLQLQVARASNTGDDANMASYLNHPMVLICDFANGTTDEPLTPDEQKQLRKIMPIMLNKVNFSSNNGVSQYEVEAVALNDIAFADQYAKIPADIEIRGETVSEILFSGQQSLASILNNKVVQSDKSKKNTKGNFRGGSKNWQNSGKSKDSKKTINSPRDYIFIFPNRSGFTSSIVNKASKETPTTVYAEDTDGFAGPVQVPYSQRIQGLFGGLFEDNSDYEFETGFKGAKQKLLNEIGKSKMVIDHLQNAADTGKEFADDNSDTSKYYDKNTKTTLKSTAKIDTKKKTISFKKGTHISSIIEEIILLSEYGQDLAKRKQSAPNGMIQWFKIIPGRYIFNDYKLQSQFNTYPEIIMFRIIPYLVPDDKFMAPNEVSRAEALDDFIRKEYNILYKGTNKDVIDFNVEFNQAFFTALMNDLGNSSGDTQDNANSSVSTEKSSVDQSSSFDAYKGNNINPNVTFGDPQATGGNIETVELRVARQFNKAILDSAVDLVKLDLNIVGDPYFLPQTGFGNYVGHTENVETELFEDNDAAADFLRGIVFTKVNFKTPLDISPDGTMLFNKDTVSETDLQVLGEFSGYYYPITVRSSFSGNKFTQELELIRNKTGIIDPTKTKTDNAPALDVMEQISKDAGTSLNDDAYQGGTYP